jgi:tryptophanyl-tRNA synthetase
MRETYQSLIDNPARLEDLLLAGAAKARKIATPFTAQLRHAVGLRDLRAREGQRAAKASKAALPVFKQYRESDGQFYFKLVDAQGNLLLQSPGFASPKDAGQAIRDLQQGDANKLPFPPAPGISGQDVAQALLQLRDA